MRKALIVTLGLALAAVALRAQSDDDDDESDYFPLVPTGNSLTFGMHVIGGPKVKFGHLGTVPATIAVGDATGLENRSYNDGTVSLDQRSAPEGGPVGDGLTDVWTYNFGSQVTSGGDIAFHGYSTNSSGAGLTAKRNSAEGWELQVGHSFGKIAGKIEFDLVAGVSFNSVIAKASASVPATLTTVTDVYPLYGQTPPTTPYSGPTFTSLPVLDANGNPVLGPDGTTQTKSTETTTMLGDEPTRTVTTSQADVHGHWEIKGAYFTVRVGPLLKVPITERLKFSVGAGAAVNYIGTRYLAQESVDLTDATTPLQTVAESNHSVAMPAYYADANAEYWMTERTGLYVGAIYQKSSSYDQVVFDRTANIDLSSSYGVQSGITLRF